MTEARLLYFIYTYFSFCSIDPNLLKKENLYVFWNNFLPILRLLNNSRAPSTLIWLVDLILMLTRKYSPKEIISDQRFRNEFHKYINEKLMAIS